MLLTIGGDSGIGRAIAYDFVKEGARVVIVYYDEERDARHTAERIGELGGKCLRLRGGEESVVCQRVRDENDRVFRSA